jgi:hypothetical protein
MITLPAATLIVTMLAASAGVTTRPAASAILRCKFEVSAKSSMVPLAVKVSTTVTAEGAGDGGDGGDGGDDGGSLGGDGGCEGGGAGGPVSLPPPQAQHKPTLFSRPLIVPYWGPGSADCHL